MRIDMPHLFSTRRIGPDLTRVGLKYSDEWHLAHFWDPRMLVPDSIMPRFRRLFDAPDAAVKIVDDADGNRTLEKNAGQRELLQLRAARSSVTLTPNADGLLFVPDGRGKYPVIFTPNEEFTGEAVRLAGSTEELTALIAYLQKLGTNRGKWRDVFEPQRLEASQVSVPRSDEWIAHGKEVYERRCVGCHGDKGDGNGPAATFMYKHRPRNFTLGVFKFRHDPEADPDRRRPAAHHHARRARHRDADLARPAGQGPAGGDPVHQVRAGGRPQSDPNAPYAYFVEEPAEAAALHRRAARAVGGDRRRAARKCGSQAKCWECHGQGGKGDGEKAAGLKDDFGFPIRPANLTTGQFKSGPVVRGHLPHHDDRPHRHADAVLPAIAAGGGPLGAGLLRAVAVGVQGSADRRAAQHPARSQGGAERSGAEGEFVGPGLCARRREPGHGSRQLRRRRVGGAARHGAYRDGAAGRPAGAAAKE